MTYNNIKCILISAIGLSEKATAVDNGKYDIWERYESVQTARRWNTASRMRARREGGMRKWSRGQV